MIVKLSWANVKSKPGTSFLSVLLFALSIMLISAVLLIGAQFEKQFKQNIGGVDMVVGAKGSPLQLILSSLLHVDNPTGNVKADEATKVAKHPLVSYTIPVAYGDYYRGFRILGTTELFFAHYESELGEGKWFYHDMEVVIGKKVAEKTGLKVGDYFEGNHGDSDGHRHHQHYKVVGILASSSSVTNQLIIGSLPSVWAVHHPSETKKGSAEHHHHTEGEIDHHGHAYLHQENHYGVKSFLKADKKDKKVLKTWKKKTLQFLQGNNDQEITALLVKFRSPMANLQLPRMVNERTNMQAALPAIEINRMFDLLGIGIELAKTLAGGLMLIAALSTFVMLYNTLKERKYELALMRTMGASSMQLVVMVCFEGIILAGLGWSLGWILSRGAVYAISTMSEAQFHIDFNLFTMLGAEWMLFIVTIFVGVFAAIIPAFSVTKMDVARVLSKK